MVSCIDITSRWVAEFHSATLHDAGSIVARAAELGLDDPFDQVVSHALVLVDAERAGTAQGVAEALPVVIGLRSVVDGEVAEGDGPHGVDAGQGRPAVGPAGVEAGERLAETWNEVVGPGAVGVAHSSWVRVLDVEDAWVDLRPATCDRARRDVREVVLQALGQPHVDEGLQLGREGTGGVRAGDDQVDLGEALVDVALAPSDEVRHLVDAEAGALWDPVDVRDVVHSQER